MTTEHERLRVMLASPAAVGVARDLVASQLFAWDLTYLRDDVTLVTDELVTNAVQVRHFVPIKVKISRDLTGIMVAVWDSSPHAPVRRQTELTLEDIDRAPDEYEFGGWGLTIVEQVSSSCGVSPDGRAGKWVWAQFKA
jgi:anti-sigma regulatory factor (Ser/Thr protein kinase)